MQQEQLVIFQPTDKNSQSIEIPNNPLGSGTDTAKKKKP